MVEKNLIINGKTLQYKGIFQEDKLFSVINNFLDKNGYTKFEKKSEELVVQKGRETLIELRPYKVLATYMTFQLRIKIVIQIDSEVREEVDGIPQHFQNGTVSMIFDSWLISDYVFRWQMKPIVYFLKGIINKFIFTLFIYCVFVFTCVMFSGVGTLCKANTNPK